MLVPPPPLVNSTTFAKSAGEAARRRMEDFDSSTHLRYPRSNIFQLSWDDIELLELLGQGSFSSVYKVVLRHDAPVDCEAHSDDGDCDCSKDHTIYALKCLHHKTTTVENCFKTAAVDLAMEAKLLANLLHPNIVTLWGVKSGCVSDSYVKDHGFFLLLDFLVDTLDERLDAYRENCRKRFSFTNLILMRSKKTASRKLKEMKLFLERLENIAFGIASGMEYLHLNRILFRDLKPQNIGFDTNGVVRIFDFGLAREIEQGTTFRVMTGQAGTPRYMAPENFSKRNGKRGGFPTDAYSFTILLWEILTLGKPFDHIKSILQLNEEVVRGNQRPPLNGKGIHFSPSFKSLFEAGWNADPELRPTFTIIKESIQTEAVDLSNYLASFADKPSSKNRVVTRRNSWCIEESRAEICKPCESAKAGSTKTWFGRRNNDATLPTTGLIAMPVAAEATQQPTLASLADRTRKNMVETLKSESKRAEDDIKRLQSMKRDTERRNAENGGGKVASILKVEPSVANQMLEDELSDSDGSEGFVSVTSVSTAPARLKARKARAKRVQPQEAAPNLHSSLNSLETSSTAPQVPEKSKRRSNRKKSSGYDNFGSTTVSTFQPRDNNAKKKKKKSKNSTESKTGRSTGADSHVSMGSAKSAKSRSSVVSKKKSKESEVVLDTVQSVQRLQYLLHQESDKCIDANI